MPRPEIHGQDTAAPAAATILVVDDNPLIVDVLKSLLKTEHYQVFSARNGQEALDLLGAKRVDVVICDVMMPRMGGYQLHEALRSKPDHAHIPFIFLTALDSQTEIARGKEVGADDYLCKPFHPEELLSVVKGKVLRSQNLKNLSEQKYDSYRRRVIHTLSHEFRTPLVAINTGMELLMEHAQTDSNGRTKDLLAAIRRGGLRLEKLVNDFMILQQIDAGVAKRLFDTKARVVPLCGVVERYLQSKFANYEALGATHELVDRSESGNVKVVEAQLADCLDRIVSNAVKFSVAGKHVEIHLYRVEEEMFVDVRDRGIGLDLSKLDEAIDVFGQIDRERLEQQGGGLGLPIATHYAAVNHGRLEFEPRNGGGSIVSIVLPVVKDQS